MDPKGMDSVGWINRSPEEYRSAFQIFDIGGSLQLLLVQEGRAEIEQKKCLSVKWVSIY